MKRWLLILITLGLVVGGCRSAKTPELSPHQVTYQFYRWYIGYPGNPLVDKEYRSSPYMTAALIEKIDQTIASFDKSAYDPILMAQNIPESFGVEQPKTSGDRSTVLVRLFWGPQSSFTDLEITLVLVENEWKIDDITRVDK
jgi:hypothetical protein